MRKLVLAAAVLSIGATFALASPSFAQAADPTMDQIYSAAEGGHLDQAQQMITQVLADHPNSAKAHYVQAELYAKEGKIPLARAELGTAERLNPGLTEFKPLSVQELKSELGSASPRSSGGSPQIVSLARPEPHFPWGALIIGLIVVGLVMMLFRRRAQPYNQYPAAGGPGGVVGGPGAPPSYGPGYGPGYGP